MPSEFIDQLQFLKDVMAKKRQPKKRNPKVRLAYPNGRPIQLRYFCPEDRKEIRISTGTYDESEALDKKTELEAKLTLGLQTQKTEAIEYGPMMDWEHFREEYRMLHLKTLRDTSAEGSEYRLDVSTRIMRPKTISDIFNTHAMQVLQAKLAAGECSRRGKPRAPHTVGAYMTSVKAAANWAYDQGWLEEKPRFKKRKISKSKGMKGRPLTSKEFSIVLKSVEAIVGEEAKDSWTYLIRGLWQSGLRLDEIMNVSWDIPNTIMPEWREGKLPILGIPAEMQKNDTDENIPLLNWFEAVLLETPKAKRTGYVFNPKSLQLKLGRSVRQERFNSDWVGKVISRIGAESGIIVKAENTVTGAPTKYVSAHDLRRSCGQRLLEAGVPPLVISRILRHSSWETTKSYYVPGSVQNDAKVLRNVLKPDSNEETS